MGTKSIAIEDLELHERCQVRAEVRTDAVDEYTVPYESKEHAFPPLSVFKVGSAHYVVDGFHRAAAAIKAGRTFIKCKVVGSGTLDDAEWFATSVNQQHGIRRSNADKRSAVLHAIANPIGQEQSNRVIAKHVGVGDHLVATLRAEWEDANAKRDSSVTLGAEKAGAFSRSCPPKSPKSLERPSRRKGADGKVRPAKKPAPQQAKTAVPFPADFKAALLKAERGVKQLRADIKTSWPGDFASEFPRVDKPLEDLAGRLRLDVPQVCEQCSGSGCKWCSRKGWHSTARARSAKRTVGVAK